MFNSIRISKIATNKSVSALNERKYERAPHTLTIIYRAES